jgi:hypothetical protein
VDTPAKSNFSSDFLVDCGVQLVDLGTDPMRQIGRDFMRQIVYRCFVAANQVYIDRVLIADLFDTIFQKDPFSECFCSDRVYYSDEGFQIQELSLVAGWVESLFPKVGRMFGVDRLTDSMIIKIWESTVVNGGLTGGGVRPFLQHLEFMMKMGDLETLTPWGTDQGFLDLGLALRAPEFPYQIDPPNSTFLGSVGALLMMGQGDAMGKEIGSLMRDGRIPNVIHQYDRSALLVQLTREVCPGPFY